MTRPGPLEGREEDEVVQEVYGGERAALNLDTGWHPTIDEYHALASEGVISSSMLTDLVPPAGRPRLYEELWVSQSRVKRLVGVDAWRGSIVDCVLTEGGEVGYFADIWCRGFKDASGKVIAVIPPKLDMRYAANKEKMQNWRSACEREGWGVIGLSTDRNGKEKLELSAANKLLDEVELIADFIREGRTEAAELARELLMGSSGVSQLSHRFTWNGLACRWRPDRIYEEPAEWGCEVPCVLNCGSHTSSSGASYAHVSLKVTMHAHPGPFWANYQKQGWGMRDAFYELGWSRLVAEQRGHGREHIGKAGLHLEDFPWALVPGFDLDGNDLPRNYRYVEEEPIDWIVVAVHHLPVPEVYVHIVPEQQRRLARKRCTAALQLLKQCIDTNNWSLPEERSAQLGRDPRSYEWGDT